MARWLRECFSWQFQDVLFHKGAPFWHACLNVCVCAHVCLENLFIFLCVNACISYGIDVCTWVILKANALFFSAFTLNKVCWKEDQCSVHYVISLDHTEPVLTLKPPKNLTCQPRKRDKEDTESITTPISRLMFHIQTVITLLICSLHTDIISILDSKLSLCCELWWIIAILMVLS